MALSVVADSSVFDRTGSVTFTLQYGPPSPFPNPFVTCTEVELLANPRRNLFRVGNEYLQAATIVDNGSQSYTISTLLRGRFGTDSPAELTHGAGETIVFLDGAEMIVSIDPVRLNQAFNYKVVTTNQDLADATPVSFTWTGGTAKPLSPSGLRGTRNASGDLFIQWNRRARIGAGMTSGTDVPLAEEREVYDIEIYNGSTVVDSWRVTVTGSGVERPTFEILKDIKHLATNTEGTTAINSTGAAAGDVLMLSRQRIFADEINLISFDVNAVTPSPLPRTIGLLSEASIVDDLTGVLPSYGWARGSTGQILTIEEFVFSAALSSGLSAVANTRLTIKTTSNQVSYYQDDLSHPYLSTTALPAAASGAYRVYVREPTPNSLEREVVNVLIEKPGRITTYTAEQQITRFGSIQSSIKVRVYQVSGIVGRGGYREALL